MVLNIDTTGNEKADLNPPFHLATDNPRNEVRRLFGLSVFIKRTPLRIQGKRFVLYFYNILNIQVRKYIQTLR